MTRTAARQTLNTQARRHTCVVYFTKRSGEARRMVCRYFGATSTKRHLMKVWDLEKGAARHVNLDTVSEIKVLGTAREAAAPKAKAEDRAPAEPQRSGYEEVKAQIDRYFY